MKKFFKILISILILLIFVQLIYFNIIKKQNNAESNVINVTTNSLKENQTSITSIDKLFSSYQGNISKDDIEKYLYTFINKTMPKIYDLTNNQTELQTIYINNKEELDRAGIYSQSDFEKLVNAIKKMQYNKNTLYSNTFFIASSYKKGEQYDQFKIKLLFNADDYIDAIIYLSNQDQEIKIGFIDTYDEALEQYQGELSKQEIQDAVTNFENDIQSIEQSTNGKSENQIKQYYAINKTWLTNLGITSENEFVEIANKINSMTWNDNPTLVKTNLIKNTNIIDKYDTFKMFLTYSSSQHISFYLNVAQSNNTDPKIIIKRADETAE